ncbi:MAG TPA: Gx transporter family protein [Bacillota bacterium]|nr:Gx transporter family protein [Bacillota bacterium]HOL15759.1 Gx transporter family protein [Bacillota bacterium]
MRRNLIEATHLAVLVSIAVVIHTVEAALPLPMPVPGVRLGLANMITLLTIVLYGARSGLLVAVLRSVIGSLIGGTFLGFGFWLSLAGGVACTAVMSLAAMMMRNGYLSLVSVSVLGAAAHNLVQLAVAGAIIGSAALLRGYFPLLLLLAVPTGVFTGLAAYYLEGVTRRALGHAGGPGVDG